MKIDENYSQKVQIGRSVFFMILMMTLLSGSVHALGDPINQTLTEFTNLTRSDNALEVLQEMNQWIGGLFGIAFLIMIFAVSFSMTLFFRNDIPKALMFTMFITTLSSVFLYTVDLVPDIALFFTAPLFLVSVIFAVITK